MKSSSMKSSSTKSGRDANKPHKPVIKKQKKVNVKMMTKEDRKEYRQALATKSDGLTRSQRKKVLVHQAKTKKLKDQSSVKPLDIRPNKHAGQKRGRDEESAQPLDRTHQSVDQSDDDDASDDEEEEQPAKKQRVKKVLVESKDQVLSLIDQIAGKTEETITQKLQKEKSKEAAFAAKAKSNEERRLKRKALHEAALKEAKQRINQKKKATKE